MISDNRQNNRQVDCVFISENTPVAASSESSDLTATTNSTSPRLTARIPDEVFSRIFSYLNLHELGVSRVISKRSESVIPPDFWRAAIYRDFAFGVNHWAQWDAGVNVLKNAGILSGVTPEEEMLSLPINIAEELRRSASAFPGKSIRETHVLVRMPEGLTINRLGELAKKYFPTNNRGYGSIRSDIINELGNRPADESAWLLMTTDVIDESRNKSYAMQREIVADLAGRVQVPCRVPTVLEAVTCVLAAYFNSRLFLFSNPRVFTNCQERVEGGRTVVGVFDLSNPNAGFCIDRIDHDQDLIGVAALRKF